MSSLLEEDWKLAFEVAQQNCSALRRYRSIRDALLNPVEAETWDPRLQLRSANINFLLESYRPRWYPEGDREKVFKIVSRCRDASESFRKPFDSALLSYIGRIILQIALQDVRIGERLADGLATSINGLITLHEVCKTKQITRDFRKSLGELFESIIVVLAESQTFKYEKWHLKLEPRLEYEGRFFAKLSKDLNFVKDHAKALEQRLASIADQALPIPQATAYDQLTKLLMERLDRIENALQGMKTTPGLPAMHINETESMVEATRAWAQRASSVLSDQTIMTRDTDEYVGAHAPPYSIDPPGDPATRCYTLSRKSETITTCSEASMIPTGDEQSGNRETACATSVEVMKDVPHDTENMRQSAADGFMEDLELDEAEITGSSRHSPADIFLKYDTSMDRCTMDHQKHNPSQHRTLESTGTNGALSDDGGIYLQKHYRRKHRIVVSEDTGEALLTAGATWDYIQEHELFRNGLVDVGDVCQRLKRLARCDGRGPLFEEGDVRRAIAQSAVAQRLDELI